MLCDYKDIFGKIKTGLHSYRIFNIAIIDVFLTILVAYILKQYYRQQNFMTIFIKLIILGIILHRLFCVRTTIDKILFN